MILRKMSFKGFLQKFTFRSRHDFDDDRNIRKTEKDMKILRRELAVNTFMFDSAYYDHEVEAALLRMKRSATVCRGAVNWFESELKSKREMTWKKLMTGKKIDLSSAMPYLIKVNENDDIWQTLENRAKDYVDEWIRRVNFTILEMFILRHKELSLSKKIKYALFTKKK